MVFTPFTGIRMVCVETPGGAERALAAEAGLQCDRFCPRPNAPASGAPGRHSPDDERRQEETDPGAPVEQPLLPGAGGTGEHQTDCVLFADGSLFVLISGVAVVPAAAPIDFSRTTVPFEPEESYVYLAPALALHTPPPKA